MKTIIVFLGFILWTLVGVAQSDEEKAFIDFGQQIETQRKEARSKKDYRQAGALAQQFIDRFTHFSPEIQKQYISSLGDNYYNLACYLALQKRRKPAVEAFEMAVKNQWYSYSHAKIDTDLDYIRNDSKFKELMQSIRSKGDYLYILQQSGGYVKEKNGCSLLFTYMNAEDSNLVRVRRHFNLDSIAGNGDEISKIKNLMRWVHDVVRHDGMTANPKLRNAIDMVELCRREKRGVSCRMMAQILNECYLAMGFKSRFITCMPKVLINDCHVINAVYSESLKKWLWMDPTFNAYVTDENGLLLSISEVRERLKNDRPLVLNEDANWNHSIKQTKAQYLDSYMAKNLYYLTCSLRSEFNAETNYAGKVWGPRVSLIPDGYQLSEDRKTEFITCDEENFWQLPDKKE